MRLQSKRQKTVALILIAILSVGILLTCVFVPLYFIKEDNIDYKLMGYYCGNLTYNQLSRYPFDKYTHILFAFSYVEDGEDTPSLTAERVVKLNELKTYLKENNLDTKVILSVASSNADFGQNVDTAQKIDAFAAKCAVMVAEYGLDGIDLDWEFPKLSEFKTLTRLLQGIRKAIGGDKLLSIATTANLLQAAGYQNRILADTLDFVNVMTYDFSDTNQASYTTTKNVMFTYHLLGYKKTQLNMGIPFYGRSKNKDYMYNSYAQIKPKLTDGTLTLHETASQSYAACDGAKVSFDSAAMIKKKMNFIKRCGYGGAFCWHLTCDSGNDLFDAMYTIYD